MKQLVAFILFLFFAASGKGQHSDSSYFKSIKEQAEKMGQFLIDKNYDSFARYNHPTVLSMMGGKEKMKAFMEKSVKELEAQGISFLKVKIGEPSQVIQEKLELQAIIPQEIEMKVPDGRMITKAALIAISADKGENWWFVDLSDKDISLIKKIFPNLSSKLVIPKNEEPILLQD